jgi:hypothetical protein
MNDKATWTKHFYILAACLCSLYFGSEILFNHYTRLGVDEFWFGNNIFLYKDKLPYRDFPPYKSVLGYYLLLPAMLSNYGPILTLVFAKNAMAFLNAVVLFISSCWLTRYFSRSAVLLSLLLLIISETFISYSTNIRVDLPSYWFCFFAFLFMLEKRTILAGALLGLGFITSQKAIWYIVASNLALGVTWLIYSRQLKSLWHIMRLNLMMAFVICAYLLFWSSLADTYTVINNVFFDASAMYHLEWYDDARYLYWKTIISNNPLLFLLWPLTLISLAVTYQADAAYQRRLTIIVYSFTILLCLMPYKQVFPYYMQATYPIFFILYAAFFSWLEGLMLSDRPVFFGRIIHWLLLVGYTLAAICVYLFFRFPPIYLLILAIPALLAYSLKTHAMQRALSNPEILKMMMLTSGMVGIIFQSLVLAYCILVLNGDYQKANLKMIDALLQDGSDYVAGTDYIYNKKQPIAGLRHLMGPAIDYLYQPTPTLRAVMLASLYEDPTATKESVISQLKQSSVKFFVNSYRIVLLPPQIKNYLDSEYQHFSGSIYLYSPTIAKGQQTLTLKFSGHYRLEGATSSPIQLNHHAYQANEVVYLSKGKYVSQAQQGYRLRLIPDNLHPLDDPSDQWRLMVI